MWENKTSDMPEYLQPPKEIVETERASFIEKQRQELSEIQKITSQDKGEFNIVSPQETDSLGTDSWKSYLKREKLLDAWSPPEGSPYLKFIKTKTINSVESVGKRIKPRYSPGEEKSRTELVNLIGNLIHSKYFNENTAVIFDSGGAHSVAMAAGLAEWGWQPIVMLESIPHSKGSVRSEQDLATLLYFSEEINKLKQKERMKPNAPPAFVLNSHRYQKPSAKDKVKVDNSYVFTESDFPSAEELKKHGIKRIVYLTEGDQKGKLSPGFRSLGMFMGGIGSIIKKYEQAGIEIIYTGISPWGPAEQPLEHRRISLPELKRKEVNDITKQSYLTPEQLIEIKKNAAKLKNTLEQSKDWPKHN